MLEMTAESSTAPACRMAVSGDAREAEVSVAKHASSSVATSARVVVMQASPL